MTLGNLSVKHLLLGTIILSVLFGAIAGFGAGMQAQYNSDKAFLEDNSIENNHTLIGFDGELFYIQKYTYVPLDLNITNITIRR